MSKKYEQTMENIIAIIEDYEEQLSDGFEYYCNDVNTVLTNIAKRIYDEIHK